MAKDDTSLAPSAARRLRDEMAAFMRASRPGKYDGWVRLFRLAPYVSPWRDELEFVVMLYFVVHYIDDVADGDVPVPAGYSSAADYVFQKLRFLESGSDARDDIEWALLYCLALTQRLGIDIIAELRDIFVSLLFDASRRNPQHLELISEKALHENHRLCDINGVVGICLKVFRETSCGLDDLLPLGIASRIHLTLKDLHEEMRIGLCNIPREDIEAFGIRDLHDTSSDEIRRWCVYEARRGLRLIDEHRKRKRSLILRPFTRLILLWMFEMPAAKHLERVLKENTRAAL